ncbi:coiled-coil domain-containing protein [Helicobacter pylori]
MGSFFPLGKSSNDTQENPKDAQKKEEEFKEVREENAKLNRDKNDLARERDKLADQNKTLTETNQKLTTEKERLERESKNLATDKENLTNQLNASQKQVNELKNSKQVLENEKAELTNKITDLSKDKEKLTQEKTDLTEKNKVLITEKENLEQKHAPYQKLEKLYEAFLEVKGCLNFNFVATTHSAMDLIACILSDSKYYLESLYNKTSQELSDKRSDKGEKLAELFDLLFEYIKDSKFERLKEPSTYDSTCKKLYPEQNTSQKIQRVVLIGYTYNKKTPPYYTIVDMGS